MNSRWWDLQVRRQNARLVILGRNCSVAILKSERALGRYRAFTGVAVRALTSRTQSESLTGLNVEYNYRDHLQARVIEGTFPRATKAHLLFTCMARCTLNLLSYDLRFSFKEVIYYYLAIVGS